MSRRDTWSLQKRVDYFDYLLRVDRWFYRLPRYMRNDVSQGWPIASELASQRDCPAPTDPILARLHLDLFERRCNAPLFGPEVVREYFRQREGA